MVSDITAVIGLYMTTDVHLEMTKTFVEKFNEQFPNVPLSLSCVGCPQKYQDELKRLYGEEVTTGTTERVAFAETWDHAILGVKTSKFVFLHNDMYLDPDFFKELDKYLDEDSSGFYVYSTVEPLKNLGWPRPGKFVAAFGEDFDDFKEEKFLKFANTLKGRKAGRGYGFYLAGYTKNLMDVGGFDYQTFFPVFCEDDDILVRIREKGYKLYTAPGAVVYHFGSKTTRELGSVGMTPPEIESNRKFARKWGFEARYLWETGYEFEDEPLTVGTETIGFEVAKDVRVPVADLINVEPLVDRLNIFHEDFQKYLNEINRPEKAGPTNDCDIVVTLTGPENFHNFAYLLGDLRYNYKSLKPGTVGVVGHYQVEIRRIHKDQSRTDSKNYLSLLQNNK